jgi:zinc transporter
MLNTTEPLVSAPGRTHTITDGTYGSDDATGLVWGYEFLHGQPARPIGSVAAAERLSAGSGEAWLWLHFNLSNSRSERWLREHLALPAGFYDLIAEHPSTRVEAVDDALLAVIRDVPYFGSEARSDASMTICVDTRLMISVRTQQLRSVDRLRTAVRRGDLFDSPVELLAHLLRDQADVLMEIVREASTRVDDAEDKLLDSSSVRGRGALGSIRRGLVRVQRVLAPEPAALFRLLNRPPSWLRDIDVAELRRSAEELSAAVADSSAVVERVRIVQDELSAKLDEATNRTLYILTVLTAIVAPFEFISQLFGMGVGGVPFHDNAHGFWLVFLLILTTIGLGAALVRVFLKRS